MTKCMKALAAAAALAAAGSASATPSTVVWTPATTYTQPYLVPHLTYDTYFAETGDLPGTYGLTLGVIPSDKIQGEIGFDLFYPSAPFGGYTSDMFQLNGKLTAVEGLLGKWSPALSVGIANVGFESDFSDYHTLYGVLGKSTPFGTIAAGGYYGAGSEVLWTGSDGSEERAGFMASYVTPDLKIGLPGLDKIVLSADYSSGNNWFGAFGAAASFYFTPAIALLTGPVFFNDGDLYQTVYGTDWMWTAQVDVDIDLIRKK